MTEETMLFRMDPDYHAFYKASPGYDLKNLEQFRQFDYTQEKEFCRADPAVNVREKWIAGPLGKNSLKVRIYEPVERDEEMLPCLLFFHAGGFLFGSAMRHEGVCNRYCKKVGCIVVSVDYRLAPEHKMPAAFEDAYAALEWVASGAHDLNVDINRIAVGGYSAGGNLAAAVALKARDCNGPKIIFQMPMCALLNPAETTFSSKDITTEKVWSYHYSELAREYYLDPECEVDCYMFPGMTEDLSNLPPCFSCVGNLDPFLDENVEYWTRLSHAGVNVEGHVIPGCFHCFELNVPAAARSRQVFELTYTALRRVFQK